MSGKNRKFTAEFRIGAARRIRDGESVSALSHELAVKRSVLYRWRDALLKDGEAGLQKAVGRPPGRPSQTPPPSASPLERAQLRIAELERKVGRQELENDFLKRAFKRVEELRRKQENGATASMPKSKA